MINMSMEVWMSIVGFLSAIAEFPQVIQILKRKSSGDISLMAWTVIYFAQCSWLRYGYDIGSTCIMITNSINLLFTMTIMYLVVKYRNRKENNHG